MSLVGRFLIEDNKVRTDSMECMSLRFNCRRCGAFCCRLGGPVVSQKDLMRLRRSVPKIDHCTETVALGPHVVTMLVSKPSGECILFSKRNKKQGVCSKYRYRPDVCRTYPFELVKEGTRLTLRVLPCTGLNRKKGRLIDEKFVRNHLRFATVT